MKNKPQPQITGNLTVYYSLSRRKLKRLMNRQRKWDQRLRKRLSMVFERSK